MIFFSLILSFLYSGNIHACEELIAVPYAKPAPVDRPVYDVFRTPFIEILVKPTNVPSLKKLCLRVIADRLVHENGQVHAARTSADVSNNALAQLLFAQKLPDALLNELKSVIKRRNTATLAYHFFSSGKFRTLDQTVEHDFDGISGFALEDSGRFLFAVSRRAVMWDLHDLDNNPNGSEFERDEILRPGQTAVGFMDDGLHVFAILEGKIIVWSLETKQIVKKVTLTCDQTPSFFGAAMSKDKKFLLGTYQSKALLFSLEGLFETIMASSDKELSIAVEPQCVADHNGPKPVSIGRAHLIDSRESERGAIEMVCFSPCSSYVFSGGTGFKASVYDVKTHQLLREITLNNNEGGVTSAAFCKDNMHVLIATSTGRIFLWNLKTGERNIVLRFRSNIYGPPLIEDLSINREGTALTFQTDAKSLYFYDLVNHRLLSTAFDKCVEGIKFSQCGEIFFASVSGHSDVLPCQILLPGMPQDIQVAELIELINHCCSASQ